MEGCHLGVVIGTWHLKEFSRSKNELLMLYLAVALIRQLGNITD